MRPQLMFKLDQNPEGRGLRCDSSGLFLGRDALLQRDRNGNFEARPAAELQKVFGRVYGGETNWESRSRSVTLVANALNNGDMARATMTAVLMRLPDPGGSLRVAGLYDPLAKAGFNPDEPRDTRGLWTIDGRTDNADTSDHTARIQLADDSFSDASDDPVAEAAARAGAGARRDYGGGASQDKPIPAASTGGANNWITRSKKLWAAIVALFGNPQNTTHAAEDTHALASRILGSHLSKMPGVRAIHYHRSLSTITKGQIQSGRLPDVTVEMEDNTVQPYEILSPKQNTSEVRGKYVGVRPIAGSKFRLAEVQVMSKEEIMALPEAAPFLAEEAAAEEAEAQAAITAQEEEVEALTHANP